MITVLPGLLTPDQLAQAGTLLATATWEDGGQSAGAQARAVKNNQQLPHGCEAAIWIREQVLAAVQAHPMFLSAALPHRIFTPRVNRYAGSTNAYGLHVDAALRLKEVRQGDPLYVRTDLSCTVFLNDPAHYDGGELRFHLDGRDERVKMPAGHAVLYPGTTLHEVTPVTRGERLACFFWVQSLVRSTEQRQLLHDMDMQLLSLRQRLGECAETTALTGTYHNLLRMWAQA